MEIVSRISKGSKMDQIYIPKNRTGLPIGNYVVIKPLDINISIEYASAKKLVFYKVFGLEQIKLKIIEEVFNIFSKNIERFDNIIITGSFLDEGFNFNDLDMLILTDDKINLGKIEELINKTIGIKSHILILTNREFLEGLSSDPIYEMMLSRYISLKKIVYNTKRKINSQFLDLNLLKSKPLIDNFELLNGKEKYYLVKNMISILLFIQEKKLSDNFVDKEIKELFGIKINQLKENMLEKSKFLKIYKDIYNKTQNLLFENNGTK